MNESDEIKILREKITALKQAEKQAKKTSSVDRKKLKKLRDFRIFKRYARGEMLTHIARDEGISAWSARSINFHITWIFAKRVFGDTSNVTLNSISGRGWAIKRRQQQ